MTQTMERPTVPLCTNTDEQEEECGQPMFQSAGFFLCQLCDGFTPAVIAANKSDEEEE